MTLVCRILTGVSALGLLVGSGVRADEGMWLYNAPPRQLLLERYGFDPSARWLEHLQKSSVRVNSGGSSSFVSADGLLISNHHVGAPYLQKLSDAQHDYLRNGFYARTRAEEKPCPGMELNVLMRIEDVTAQVNAAVQPGQSAAAAFAARRAVMAAIEKEALAKTGWRSDVVTLYQGGQYHLYSYKRYTDVRLVFAPEQQIAFFGGDPDNFEYPRFDLDICLFRAYENGQPAAIEHFLKWSPAGVAENELVFVSGHPGHTARQLSVAELECLRDQQFPYTLARLYRLEVKAQAFSQRDAESARRAKGLLFSLQNGRKARGGMLATLLDPEVMREKQASEKALRDAVAGRDDLKAARGAWERIQTAQQLIASNMVAHALFETGHGFNSPLFSIARSLLRSGDERLKPNGERLQEYRDSNRQSLELGLFSPEPIYDDLEQLRLTDGFEWLAQNLGLEHPLVQEVLAGKSPRERAAELLRGTRVRDIALRQQLYAGGAAAVAAAKDPMIELARLVDPEARRLRQLVDTQEEVKRQAYGAIAAARFQLQHGSSFPDATSTLRLAFGTVRGYEEEGRPVPFQTTFAGLYQRAADHQFQPPFNLPAPWLERKRKLDLKTPFNFVSTADIIGGNSGSPVVNRNGEFVGIIFDGNIQSLGLDFVYTDKQARAVSVNSQAIIQALRKVYHAPALADELLAGKSHSR